MIDCYVTDASGKIDFEGDWDFLTDAFLDYLEAHKGELPAEAGVLTGLDRHARTVLSAGELAEFQQACRALVGTDQVEDYVEPDPELEGLRFVAVSHIGGLMAACQAALQKNCKILAVGGERPMWSRTNFPQA